MTNKMLKKISDERDVDENDYVEGIKYFKKNA